MAENIPDGNAAPPAGAPQGHRTIKLTPLNVKHASEEDAAATGTAEPAVNTSTIKIGAKMSLTPKAVPPPVSTAPGANPAPMGMETKTQAVPLGAFKRNVPPVSLSSDSSATVVIPMGGKTPVPGSTTTMLSAKPGDTETKGIPLSGLASVPQHEQAEVNVQTSTVKLNRPAPRPMSTHSSPISTQSGPIPATPTKKMQIPTLTAPMKTAAPAAGSPTVRLGGAPSAPVSTSTTNIKLDSGSPAKKISFGTPVATSTTNIKLTGLPSSGSSTVKLGGAAEPASVPPPAAPIPVSTSTTGIKLGGMPSSPVSTSTTGIKLGGVPAPAASTVKLGTPAAPGNPMAPTLTIKKNNQNEQPSASPASGTSAENGASKKESAKGVKLKKKSAPVGGEPHILFSVSSIVALIAVLLLAAVITIQYLNHWEGMQIQIPGLEFLTLGK